MSLHLAPLISHTVSKAGNTDQMFIFQQIATEK